MKKNGICRRLLLVSLLTSSLTAAPVYAAPKADSLQSQKAAAENEASALQQELVELLDKMGKLEEDLIAKGEEIIQAEEDLEDARKLEEVQYEAMKLRIKYMYEEGRTTAFETLIGAESFSDLLNRAEYVAEVHIYDRAKLQEYEDTKKSVEQLKEQLVEEQANMQNMQAEYETEEGVLTTTLEEKREEIAGFDAQIQAAAEAAAREAAERAAQRQANAGSHTQNRTSGTGGTNKTAADAGNSGGAGTDTGNSGSAPGTDAGSTGGTPGADTGNTGGTPEADTGNTGGQDVSGGNESGGQEDTGSDGGESSGNSAAAQTIVNAAYGQLGVPYVMGGTGNGGWDCSGLVQYCHSMAGISLPRTSQAQGGCGVAVSNPQPGDIVCYGSHVGIYIGGGQMIHAPKPGDNVKVAAVYGSPWYRRCW